MHFECDSILLINHQYVSVRISIAHSCRGDDCAQLQSNAKSRNGSLLHLQYTENDNLLLSDNRIEREGHARLITNSSVRIRTRLQDVQIFFGPLDLTLPPFDVAREGGTSKDHVTAILGIDRSTDGERPNGA